MRGWADSWLGRLMIVQGYLHSDDSPSIKMRLVKTSSGDRLRFARVENPRTKPVLSRLMKLLARNKKTLGGSPLRWMMSIGKIGDGSHLGGCFPMHARPGPSDSDLLGRPFGFRRTHVVDSSVFPSIPATTITLSVMANAHRIASAALPASS
jgi:choline dehydrogenase-like flavoprotein